MTIYHVYLKCLTHQGDALLTFTSRYVADEFFRALGAKKPSGDDRHPTLQRETPQFWCYALSGFGELDPTLFLLQAHKFYPKAIFTFLSGSSGQRCPTPQLVDGKDWVNGGTFFIRNKREPNLYWAATHVDDSPDLVVSLSARSKFRVRGVDLKDDDKETVLIRDDTVTVTLVSAYSHWSRNTFYVARDPSAAADQLNFSTVRTEWKFGDFFTKFGLVNESRSGSNLVVDEDLGDEWEFC